MSLYLKKRKKFLRKIIVGASLFVIGLAVFFLTQFFLYKFYPRSHSIHPIFSVLMTTLLFLVAYKPIDIAITQLFRNYLFKKKSYAHMTLMNLTRELELILDLRELSNLVVNTFSEILHLKTVALLLPHEEKDDYRIISASGWHVSEMKKIRLPNNSALLDHIQQTGPHVLVRDRVARTLGWSDANALAHDFDMLRAEWVIPLLVKDELVGIIAFSSRNSNLVFDEADFQFFRAFAEKVATCLLNALNVHELKKSNEELQDVQAQLFQDTKLRAIEQLATGLAHEIHNPLTIISGKAQVLLLQKDRNKMDERVTEVLKTIVQQTKRAADITRKLLMFSQSSGSLKEKVHLEQVLQDTIALVSYQTSLEGIEITREIRQTIPPLFVNIHEMREIFLNLILNAVQSIGTHGKIHIEIANYPNDEFVEIRIVDSGKGISNEHMDKLFNPFFTTRQDAVGLGLFVTKQIVHRYGGSIRVDSQEGEGSLFKLRFPYQGPEGDLVLVSKDVSSLPLFSSSSIA